MRTRLVALLVTLLVALLTTGLLVPALPAGASPGVERAQARLDDLGCDAGPVDGDLGPWTRSAVIRFQSRTGLRQSGRLTVATRRHLYAANAPRCDRRPVPRHSGTGRRIVISQGQNWVWLVARGGRVRAQGGIIDNPSVLDRGSYATGSYCGRAARIRWNTTSNGELWLEHFVRFAPCGIGFHRIPTWRSTGAQIVPSWMLGTNLAESHGCVRLSRRLATRLWDFTTSRTRVRVV